MHFTQKPINLVSEWHSSSAEAAATLGFGTGGKEGEHIRKQNKNLRCFQKNRLLGDTNVI